MGTWREVVWTVGLVAGLLIILAYALGIPWPALPYIGVGVIIIALIGTQ